MTHAERLANQRVLVTGGAGFIGSNVAHACLARGARVTVLDSFDPHSGANPANLSELGGRIELVRGSIIDSQDVARLVSNTDIVVNCAASTSHSRSMRDPLADLDANARGVLTLLEALRALEGPPRLVHLGTTTQTGPLVRQPADELHPEFPTDVYSANKSVSEKYVLLYAKAFGLPATVVRLCNTYGPRAAIHSPEFTFNNYFVGLALQDQAITVYGSGAQKRTSLFVDDAVEAILAAAVHPGAVGRTFLATGDEHHSVLQIAEATVRAMGTGAVTSIPWPADRLATEPGDAVFTNARIKETLGWEPQVSLGEGLIRTREYYLPRRSDYLGNA